MSLSRKILIGMALSELDLSRISSRYVQRREVYAQEKPKTLFTQQELTNMMLTVPQGLTEESPVNTPAGRWSMEEGIAVFDPKNTEELNKITLPDTSLRKKVTSAAKVIFQMG